MTPRRAFPWGVQRVQLPLLLATKGRLMLTIHHLNESRSQRVIWLAEELGLGYALVRHARDPKTMLAPAELAALHPLGKAPLLEDEGRILAETGLIVAHLARGTELLPDTSTPEGEDVAYWLHYAEGSAMPPLVMRLVLSEAPKRAPALMRSMAGAVTGAINTSYVDVEIARQTGFWEKTLARSGWFAADRFTAADVMMSFPVEMAAIRGADKLGPATRDWLARIHARDAYQRAVEKGGPYKGAATG